MKIFRIIAHVVIALIGFVFVMNWYGLHRMKTGYEVDPKNQSLYLKDKLIEDFGYEGFDRSWLQKSWVNGFQDHTYLFLVTAASPSLREAIEMKAGSEPIQESYFRRGGYLGPSEAPEWWDAAILDAADARYFEKDSNFWRFTWIGDRLYIVYFTT